MATTRTGNILWICAEKIALGLRAFAINQTGNSQSVSSYEQNNRSNYQTHRRNVREKIGRSDIANHESDSNSQLRRTGGPQVRRRTASGATSGRSSRPRPRGRSEPDRLESS